MNHRIADSTSSTGGPHPIKEKARASRRSSSPSYRRTPNYPSAGRHGSWKRRSENAALDHASIRGKEVELVNVYGFLPGTAVEPEGRTYVVSGHYDSRASSGMDATSFAPGADDDASGTAVVLELARVMSSREYPANLVFMCVPAEEQGLYGAGHNRSRTGP